MQVTNINYYLSIHNHSIVSLNNNDTIFIYDGYYKNHDIILPSIFDPSPLMIKNKIKNVPKNIYSPIVFVLNDNIIIHGGRDFKGDFYNDLYYLNIDSLYTFPPSKRIFIVLNFIRKHCESNIEAKLVHIIPILVDYIASIPQLSCNSNVTTELSGFFSDP